MKAHFRWRAPSCLWNVILGLLLVTVYVTYFIFSNMVPPLECGIDHKPLGSFAEIHTKQFHETYLRKWRPEKFHSDPNKWKQCVKKEHPDYPSINEYTERPVVVWTWHTLENFLYIHQESVRNCSVPCLIVQELSPNNSCVEEADGLIFHPPTTAHRPQDPKEKLPYQPWILFATESAANYPVLEDQDYLQKFDVTMTFHLPSDVPFTYFIDLAFYTEHWPMQPKLEKVPIMVMISNCDPKSPRNQYVKELMEHIAIDSYGSCMHNKDIPPEMADWPWWEVKWNLTSRYKFVMAIENSIEMDYVTEKLFHAFIVGTVPIYMGAPNIDQFLPSQHSIIKISDFLGAKELAAYINFLDKRDDKYAEYLAWKHDGPDESFKKLQNTSPRTGPCRLCEKIVQKQNLLPPLDMTKHNHPSSKKNQREAEELGIARRRRVTVESEPQ